MRCRGNLGFPGLSTHSGHLHLQDSWLGDKARFQEKLMNPQYLGGLLSQTDLFFLLCSRCLQSQEQSPLYLASKAGRKSFAFLTPRCSHSLSWTGRDRASLRFQVILCQDDTCLHQQPQVSSQSTLTQGEQTQLEQQSSFQPRTGDQVDAQKRA